MQRFIESCSSSSRLIAALFVILLAGIRVPVQAQERTATLTASDAADFDNFGYVLDYDQDRLIVGAPGYNGDAGGNEGRAYIFRRENGIWMEEARLHASDAEEGNEFGDAVALQGRFAYVGSNKRDNGRGGIYVFELIDGTWMEQTILLPGDTQQSHVFSYDFAIEDDRMIVGAYGSDDFSGAAYIFEQDAPGQWREVAKLTASDPASRAFFGIRVTLDGDRALIGADGSTELMGAAYIFERDTSGAWKEIAKLTASDGAPEDRFGAPVALQGEYAYVSARTDTGAENSGAVYVFRQGGGVWNQVARLTSPNPIEEGRFGYALLTKGTLLLIGAWQESTVYRYQHVLPANWEARASMEINAQDSNLGRDLVLHQDELFVGESGFQMVQGAVHTFDMSTVFTALEETPDFSSATATAYPNPFQQTTRLVLNLPTSAEVTVTVFDMLGRRVYQQPAPSFHATPKQSLILDLSHLPSGVYVYRAQMVTAGASGVFTGHIVKVQSD